MESINNIPESKEALDSYEVENLFHSWGYQPSQSPLRVVSAKGVRFTTEDGMERLDFSSCFVSHSIGHQDPRVIKAIKDQADALCSFAPNFSTRPRAVFAKMLERVLPGDISRSFISLGGTEANEAAVKIAHQATGKRKIITRYQTYHGGTAVSMTLSAGDSRGWTQVLGGTEMVTVPQPYCYRCMFGHKYPECDMQCVKYLDQVIELEGGGETVAAIIGEPVTGANGYIVPPDEYWPLVREVCDKHGVLLIADEVMTGFGRTGKWFAMDHWNVVPDIMTMAKGATCGYLPIGITSVRKELGDVFKDRFFAHGATYAGHAMSCAAGIEVLKIYESDNLIQRSAEMGDYLLDKAMELKEKHACVGDVRGKGLFVGVELVKNKKTREPIMPLAQRIKKGLNPKTEVAAELGKLGMMAMCANPGNVIGLAPPLIIEKSEIDEGVAKLDQALAAADKYAE